MKHTETHELVNSPSQAVVPAYHPDNDGLSFSLTVQAWARLPLPNGVSQLRREALRLLQGLG